VAWALGRRKKIWKKVSSASWVEVMVMELSARSRDTLMGLNMAKLFGVVGS
jgi:hypothetical protein